MRLDMAMPSLSWGFRMVIARELEPVRAGGCAQSVLGHGAGACVQFCSRGTAQGQAQLPP
ncbi:MAG: hypothetical protein AAF135_08670 [Bacteroidota bacterium]